MLVACVLWVSIALTSANASMVINEVDYDQPSTDTAEYVELFNTGSTSISLDGYRLDFINGADDSVYFSQDLTGFTVLSSDYLVICGNSATVANCDIDATPDTNLIQNGAPDGIALYVTQDSTSTLIDSMSYEGAITGITEGSSAPEDVSGIVASLSRWPNGSDTGDNSVDFVLASITPGLANVPEPSTVFLLASGLVGLAAAGRRRSHR
jgi:predicted extracellular nuclease